MAVIDLGGVDPQQWRDLLSQAEAGDLTLDRDVGANLDAVCQTYLDKLEDALLKARRVANVEGFGTFPSGDALREKFSFKGSGTPQSIDAILLEHIDTVNLIRQVVAKSIANLTETDQNTGQQVTKTGQDIPQG
ncbi:hypothetical protein [Nocardia cyriacigeorgica]|uniref:hypothetical protein n=1 Tax=Nocardia cyriacigeorgica TaxID=135487 RepID=UPI00189484FC|nr:hypothetical protein [Nocardia cyriacigeorgica]MBF6453818.1 hypothetical protein [Nocardia cyriacigeorgica]MBF6481671.1 hypothetical protein [Nocardia cyriacigeorgica]MBF6550986.1 hypothetical protein [Nocardia cyriacigeorgica]